MLAGKKLIISSQATNLHFGPQTDLPHSVRDDKTSKYPLAVIGSESPDASRVLRGDKRCCRSRVNRKLDHRRSERVGRVSALQNANSGCR
jgi:hypothetical protein